MRRVIGTFTRLSTETPALALDLDLVRLQRRVGSSIALDQLFAMWVTAAASLFEEHTGRPVIREGFQYRLDCPPPVDRFIEIPKTPLVSVESITYAVDGSPDEETFGAENYDVIAPAGVHGAPGRVVLKSGAEADEATLKAFVKDKLAPYKYPRQIAFVADLPKTATGKIQRFKLRDQEKTQG